jgi:transposase
MDACQGRPDPLAEFLGLQGFATLYVHVERDRLRPVVVIGIEDRRGRHFCSQCGEEAPVAFQEVDARRWRECSQGDLPTFIEIAPCRVRCCGGTRVEAFPWEAPGGFRMTRGFFERVAALATRLPIEEVRRMARLSWDVVARVDAHATKLFLGGERPSLDGLREIGIDEVSRTGGRVYFTIVTNLETGAVVWIGDGRSESALNSFFGELGTRRCRKVRVVVSDLFSGFVGMIRKHVPRAVHVLDRFHIIQWINLALELGRRAVFGGVPRAELGRAFKSKKWMLLMARERLPLSAKQLLDELARVNRPLYEAYLLKEQMREILRYRWRYLGALRRNLEAWCAAAESSALRQLRPLGKRVRKNLAMIEAGFLVDVKLGLVEATNGKIALLRREARGYRNVGYFKMKIFQRCSAGLNPWARIAL